MQARGHLTRSQSDKRIAGVAGGIAEYYDLDPVLVRVAFVVATLVSGVGLLAYIALWIAVPKAPAGAPAAGGRWRSSAAVRIAEERYARGEITAEQLDQIRRDLTMEP